MKVPQQQSPALRKLYLVMQELGLSPIERMEMARYLLRRDVDSFKQLDEYQIERLLDACEGYHLITTLYEQRPPGLAGGR